MNTKEVKQDIIKNFIAKYYNSCVSKRKADDLQHFLQISLEQLERFVLTEYDTELNKNIASLCRIVNFNPITEEMVMTARLYVNAFEEEKRRIVYNKLLKSNEELIIENRELRKKAWKYNEPNK